MATDSSYIKVFYFFIFISFVSSIFFISFPEASFAQKDDKDENEDKLIVKAQINLKNIDMENTKFIRVIGFINGEEAKQDIPISAIDKTKNNLNIELKVNGENGIVEADTPDEFFVCVYQVGDVLKNYNYIADFDCNEGDILYTDKPTDIRLFTSSSQVYEKSQAVYDEANLNKMKNNLKNDKVKIKVYVPLADKKDTEKLVIAAMIKGQIQSEVIEDVQAELDKSDGNTIQRTFTFDRKTDIGLIQIGDRYHACASSEDLRPPEGTECEKRIIKHLDKSNSLPVR